MKFSRVATYIFLDCCVRMADVHTKEIRSYNMSRIRGKNTKPEMLVRRFLHANGFRYRIHVKEFPGKPDIVLPKYKTVIFIQGCFWHGHNQCKYYVIPKTKGEWWISKINGTKTKDRINIEVLKEANWNVVEIWECELKPKNKEITLTNLLRLLKFESTINAR